jgi:hypothetical protein
MNLRSLLKEEPGRKIIGSEVKLGKYWTVEYGTYLDYINDRPHTTKDFYVGLRFNIKW